MGYLAADGTQEQFAHPAGGDVCTWISIEPVPWAALTGGPPLVAATFYLDASLDLSRRRLLAAARDDDVGYAVSEYLLELVVGVLRQVAAGPGPAPAPGRDADRALVAAAREAILTGLPAAGGLLPLAELPAVSPFRLSRAFTRELGVSLTRYRNRVRVARALDRLEQGEDSLALLAADLGFADQAHLCRTMRQHLGYSPAALRRLLGPVCPAG